MATRRLAGHTTYRAREASIEETLANNPILAEQYAAAAAALLSLRAEDVGWTPINRIDEEDGFTLDALKDIAAYAELQITGNPLLKRGFTLRRDNVFGKGVAFEENPDKPISARIKTLMDKPANRAVLSSPDAFGRLERAAYNAGNLFMAYRRSTETFFPIPLDEISGHASNPDLEQDVWYYQREYTKMRADSTIPEPEPTVEWYPVLERWELARGRGNKLSATINDKPVIDDVVIIDFKVNTVIGRVWGVPDVLPALPYAWAHAEYIRDASKLLKSLSTIAWKIVGKTKAQVINASAQVARAKQTGSTATMTEGTDMVSMPKAGQVDMTDGRTIASYVASALEVSTDSILSDTTVGGVNSGASLDRASLNAARNRQGLWSEFYRRVYRAAGASDVTVNFPKLAEEPLYRQAQLLQIGFAYGGLFQDEFRNAFLEVADISPLRPGLPEPSPFTIAAQYSQEALDKEEAAAEREAEAAEDAARAAANVQGQGQSKGNGTGLGSDNTLRDMDNNS